MMLMKTLKTIFVKTIVLSILFTTVMQSEEDATIHASNTDASKPAAYKFEVNFDSKVTPTSHFEIIFPKTFNVSTAIMAVSDKLDGNLDVTAEKNSIKLHRSGGRNTVDAGEMVDLKVASIINPAQIDRDWDFTFILVDGQREVETKVRTQITLIQK